MNLGNTRTVYSSKHVLSCPPTHLIHRPCGMFDALPWGKKKAVGQVRTRSLGLILHLAGSRPEGRAAHQCWVELQGVYDSDVQSPFVHDFKAMWTPSC